METLIQAIQEFMACHSLSEWQFGELALKDKHFLRQLKAGRDVRVSTVERVNAFMEGFEAKVEAAQ